ncbi:hypothetical protein GF343_04845 [Candidatus Woesearchaeota archaeon]|nr:hypothetical protein [Candidatus Woesearchaeota archaeon]
MRAEVAAGIIAWSFFLTTPFIGRQIYREHFKQPEKQECAESALEKEITPKDNKLVERCDGIYPHGLHFVLKDRSEVDYKYDSAAAEYVCRYIQSERLDTDDKMYKMCLQADKNKNKYIDRSEARCLYANLLRQR